MENFICPKCDTSFLEDEGTRVVLLGKMKGRHFTVQSLFEFSSEKGVYGAKLREKNISYEEGLIVDFYCPNCGADLTADYDRELCEFVYVDGDGKRNTFVMSKIAGKEMSFVICKNSKQILEAFGKNREEYRERMYDSLIHLKIEDT